MIMSKREEFADALSVAAAAGTALVGDVMDLGLPARDIGNGEEMFLVITVDTEVITGGIAGTIEFQLCSDAQAAIAVDGTATKHFSTGTLVTNAAASNDPRLNAGAIVIVVALPLGATYERYLGILVVTGTTATTAGKINAFLTKDKAGWRTYPKAAF
jgi:hypothetical protein